MLVMFGSGGKLVLAIIDKDIESLQQGLSLEYINPPHPPQLVKDIVVMHGADANDVMRQLREAGIAIDHGLAEKYRQGGRTDAGFRSN